MQVQIHIIGKNFDDTVVGTLVLDKGKVTATEVHPDHTTLIRNILKTDLIMVDQTRIPRSDTERWFSNLWMYYRSAYLRATKPVEKFHLPGEHDQETHGNRNGAGGGADTDKSALQKHLVDYKEDRPLTGPGTAAIAEIIPGATSVKYMDVPGIDQMHAMMGIPNPTLETDPDEYADAREALFRSYPVLDVPFDQMVFTQQRVNTVELKKIPQEFQKKPVMVVKRGGKHYLMNGHHRVFGQFMDGARSVPGWVLDLDMSRMSKRYHLPGEHDQETHGNWATGEKVQMEGKFLMGRAKAIEPIATKALTKAIGRMGGDVLGLDFKLKSDTSLLRKINQKLEENPGLTPTDAMLSVSDALRYTATFPEDKYAAGVYETLGEMKLNDFKVDKIKNYWCKEGSPGCFYQGINVRLLSPDGLKIELQFHTSLTFDIKEKQSHALYESLRTTKEPTKAKELKNQLTLMWSRVKAPVGALAIGTPSAGEV
jgi:hypothetical protein